MRRGFKTIIRELREHLDACAVWALRGHEYAEAKLTLAQRELCEKALQEQYKIWRQSWIDPLLREMSAKLKRKKP